MSQPANHTVDSPPTEQAIRRNFVTIAQLYFQTLVAHNITQYPQPVRITVGLDTPIQDELWSTAFVADLHKHRHATVWVPHHERSSVHEPAWSNFLFESTDAPLACCVDLFSTSFLYTGSPEYYINFSGLMQPEWESAKSMTSPNLTINEAVQQVILKLEEEGKMEERWEKHVTRFTNRYYQRVCDSKCEQHQFCRSVSVDEKLEDSGEWTVYECSHSDGVNLPGLDRYFYSKGTINYECQKKEPNVYKLHLKKVVVLYDHLRREHFGYHLVRSLTDKIKKQHNLTNPNAYCTIEVTFDSTNSMKQLTFGCFGVASTRTSKGSRHLHPDRSRKRTEFERNELETNCLRPVYIVSATSIYISINY